MPAADQPKTFAINVEGEIGFGVTAKDIILAIIAKNGAGGGAGYVFEYRGSAIRRLSMANRMTICNMSIEGGARAGMIAPDETTFAYIKGRPYAPKGEDWDQAVAYWRTLPTDEGADLRPRADAGRQPAAADGHLRHQPRPGRARDRPHPYARRTGRPGRAAQPAQRPGVHGPAAGPADGGAAGGHRLHRLVHQRPHRGPARGGGGRQGPAGGRRRAGRMVVPGSKAVKAQAEAEGLDRIFSEAGFEWRGAGCSMCLAMNDDKAGAGKYVASTSNRNFQGRQGPGARSLLMSPIMAAAAAVMGVSSMCARCCEKCSMVNVNSQARTRSSPPL